MRSIVEQRGQVTFPEARVERHYMVPFTQRSGLPVHLHHFQRTVDQMLDGVKTDGRIFLMVDRGFVKANQTLRRPGLHVDGAWIEGIQAHGGGGPGHGGTGGGGGRHGGVGRHRGVPFDYDPPVRKRKTIVDDPKPKKHKKADAGWVGDGYVEGILLASDVQGCVGYTGEFEYPTLDFNGGDCSMLDRKGLAPLTFTANQVFAGNAMFLHESTPMERDTFRTVVRLNVQGWEPDLIKGE